MRILVWFLYRAGLVLAGGCVLLALSGGLPSRAQDANEEGGEVIRLEGEAALEAAVVLAIRAKDWRTALGIIEAYPADLRATQQIRFVEAFVQRNLGARRRAIDLYQRMLAEDDSLIRVRLELAATFLEIGAERAAEQQYRLALASDPPARISAFIRQALATLAERRRWRFSVQGALVPDTNVNSATQAETVSVASPIGQVDTVLTEQSRERAGISLFAVGSIDRFVTLAPRRRLRFSSFARVVENEGGNFDDYTVGVGFGPELRIGNVEAALQTTLAQRWFGGRLFSRTLDMRLNLVRSLSQRVRGEAAISIIKVNDFFADARDTLIYGVDFNPTFFASPRRFWRLLTSIRRGDAQGDFESYWLGRLGGGIYQALFWGLAVYAEVGLSYRIHDDPNPFFAITREDLQLSVVTRLSKRDWTLYGFTPFIGGQILRNESTLPINDFNRERIELGVTRTF